MATFREINFQFLDEINHRELEINWDHYERTYQALRDAINDKSTTAQVLDLVLTNLHISAAAGFGLYKIVEACWKLPVEPWEKVVIILILVALSALLLLGLAASQTEENRNCINEVLHGIPDRDVQIITAAIIRHNN